MKSTITLVTGLALFAAQSTFADGSIEEITIVGELNAERQLTGAATYLGPDNLEQFVYSDIQRTLRNVPGVSLQVEDGYGLRPNIAIRGVATERSARITLLEDNVLIAPAPYSAPSAYYFPTMGRMHAVEVLKGPSAITQGPYTIGGALNMISTPIPEKGSGSVLAEAGEDATYRVLAGYGDTYENGFGFLLETHQWQSDGFQTIDRSNSDTGLDVEDYTVKLRYAPKDSRHSVQLKLQYANQDSEQSYLGLTDADVRGDAFRRYGLSALDNISTEHEQQILSYQFEISDAMTLTATAYNNEHARDWFKTEGIDFDGSTSADEMSRTSWANVIQAVNLGEAEGGLSAGELQGILDGGDTLPGSIQLRSNSREYYSRGIQFQLDYSVALGETRHDIEIGGRYHEDEEDRLQRNSSYQQLNGSLVLTDEGSLGNAGNRIQQAEALSFYIQDRIEFGNWVVTPGLRYEDIDQNRTRYETRFGRTSDPASRAADNIRDTRANDTQVWLPGLGVLYTLNDNWSVLGGIHKGFTAPTNSPGVDEEEAINYEFGARFFASGVEAEAIYFLSDYDNILGVCTASSGTDCTVGDAFNGDAATVQGIELSLSMDLARQASFQVPLQFSYTLIDSQFDTDINGTDFFGNVSAGDPIPYIPDQQLLMTVGFVQARFSSYLSLNYVDAVCVRASCGAFEKTDDSTTIDLSLAYDVTDALTLYGKVDNLTGEDAIMGRQPYGARPNRDRTALLGARFTF